MADNNLLVGVKKYGGSILYCSHNFIHSGILVMMALTFSYMKLLNDPIFLLVINTGQYNPSWLFPIQFPI